MKKFKKEILYVLCLCVMLGVTACGSRNDMNDQTPMDSNMNDATENTQGTTTGKEDDAQSTDRNENNHTTDGNGGVIDDLGDAVGEGINDIGDGVENLTDDMTGDHKNTQNNK